MPQWLIVLAWVSICAGVITALVDAFKADTISLIAFEIGMFLWMGFGYVLLLPATRPDAFNVVFWLIMQVGMVFGFLTTYPANWLLIKWGIKRGM